MMNLVSDFLTLFFQEHEGALIDGEMGLIGASTDNHAHVGLWTLAVETLRKYFRLEPGDYLIVKDPAAGGPGRGWVTLILRLSCPSGSTETELYLLRNVPAPESWGQRLPPVPLSSRGELNELILAACGSDRQAIEAAMKDMNQLFHSWKQITKNTSTLQKKLVKTYLQTIHQEQKKQLLEFPDGDALVEGLTRHEEVLRLHISSLNGKIQVEAKGTTAGRKLWIPLPAAASAVRGALMQWRYGAPIWTSMLEDLIAFRCPQQVLLNARAQDPCDEGLEEIPDLLRQLTQTALQTIEGKHTQKGVSAPHLQISFQNKPEKTSFNFLFSANPPTDPAEDAIPLICTTPDQSLESWERQGLQVLAVSERTFTTPTPPVAGKKYRALSMKIMTTKNIRLRWSGTGFLRPPTSRFAKLPAISGEVLVNGKILEPGIFHDLCPGTEVLILGGAHGS